MKPTLILLTAWVLTVAVDSPDHVTGTTPAFYFRSRSECNQYLNRIQTRAALDKQLQAFIAAGDRVRYYCERKKERIEVPVRRWPD